MSKLPRMHTAEHLLSAVMRKFYNAPRNLELHLNEKKTKCDYQPDRSLTDPDIQQIENLVNKEIAEDHRVSSFIVDRKKATEYDLWKVPTDVEQIRIVKIGDFDAQPCRGEHITNTEEIGKFQISSFEFKENNRIRIRFKLD